MKLKTITMTAVAALSLAACGRQETTAVTTANTTEVTADDNTGMPMASAGQTFANAAAASDAFEIAASKLALDRASSASIKKFARTMVDAHTGSTEKLKAAVAGTSPAIVPDPTLNPEQQASLDSLGKLNGTAFDQAYAAAQVDGHTKTLDTLKAYAASGDVPALKEFASKLVPTVTAHLNMAKGLKS